MAEKILRCTKKKVYLDIVGSPKHLPEDKLPTKKDILRSYLKLDQNVFETITKETMRIWEKFQIPTVSKSRVKQCLNAVHKDYRRISKCYSSFKNDSKFQNKLTTFRKDQETLFDVAACKCEGQCKCCKSKQVPELLQPFLKDQRSDRIMNINQIQDIIQKCRHTEPELIITDDEYGFSDDPGDTDFVITEPVVHKPRKKRSTKNNTMNIDPVALVCDRYGISDTAGAAVSTAALELVGLVTDDDMHLVIDRSKLKRAREKVGNKLYSERDDDIVGLYFDGRKDRTMYMESSEDGILHKKFKKEEHISVIGEPFGKYLGHLALDRGRAVDIKNGIIDSFGTLDFSAIGSDGTVTNTGHEGGAIRLIEEELERPLQWVICQLHLNELPFKALFAYVDGDTSSPTEFKGPLGKPLSNSLSLPPVKFDPIHTTLPDFDYDVKTLSTDQLYLYEMCKSISSGVCSSALSKRNPGAISHSRWLTVANHLLRTYIGTEKPTSELIVMVKYILNVYAPVWFTIKQNWKCVDGPSNLHKLIKESRYLSKEHRTIVDESIQRSGFFAHHENLLLAMVRDKNKKIRTLAYQRILKSRKIHDNNAQSTVRQFLVPSIKFGAKNYYDLIDWRSTRLTEPPLTMKFSPQELLAIVENGEHSAHWNSEQFSVPCHTQAVERCVKIVTECSAAVTCNRRDGIIRSKIKSRSLMPKFTSKSKYKSHKI